MNAQICWTSAGCSVGRQKLVGQAVSAECRQAGWGGEELPPSMGYRQ